MGWFTKTCKIHPDVAMKVDKDYMCQLYWYCPKCRKERREKKEREEETERLKNKVRELERKLEERDAS